jgi:hypothetical protein
MEKFYSVTVNAQQLKTEIENSAITIALAGISALEGEVTIYFKADLSAEEVAILDALIAAHVPSPLEQEEFIQKVSLETSKTSEGVPTFSPFKSYKDSSRSFSTPDYSSPTTWCHDVTFVTGETLITADNLVYQSQRVIPEGWNHYWIKWERIPNWVRSDFPNRKLKVYVNGALATEGFTVDHNAGIVSFLEQDAERVVTVDYCYGNSADFVLTPIPGKILLVDFVEIQFSVGCKFPEGSPLVFEAVYNGPALPPGSLSPLFPGWPSNTDLPISRFEYHDADDYLNESTGVEYGKAFGRLTKDFMVLPWDYLTGHTLKPVGDPTTNLAEREFNKLKVYSVSNKIVQECEIATATFYCKTKDL